MTVSVIRLGPLAWPHRLRLSLAPFLARWRQRQRHAACVAALRQLPLHTLRDLGLADYAQEARHRADIEARRWF